MGYLIILLIMVLGFGSVTYKTLMAQPWKSSKSVIETSDKAQMLMDKGIPEEVLLYNRECNRMAIDIGCPVMAYPFNRDEESSISYTRLRVTFGEISALDGKWRGNNAEFRILEPLQTNLEVETNDDTWDNEIYSGGNSDKRIWIEVKFPYFDPQYYHQTFIVNTSISVVYPSRVGGFGDFRFTSKTENMDRELTIFIISPEEYTDLREILGNGWQYGWIGLIIGTTVVFIGGYLSYQIIRGKIDFVE